MSPRSCPSVKSVLSHQTPSSTRGTSASRHTSSTSCPPPSSVDQHPPRCRTCGAPLRCASRQGALDSPVPARQRQQRSAQPGCRARPEWTPPTHTAQGPPPTLAGSSLGRPHGPTHARARRAIVGAVLRLPRRG
eukprot:scaffold663_cov139-Isochrysis_galbana.AAC.2